MKKLLVMVAAAMMAVTSVNAQTDGYDTKHEVGVFYGAGSISDVLSVYSSLFSAAAGEQSSWWGPIGVEYFYHATPVVSVGGAVTYASCEAIDEKSKRKDLNESFISVMPSVKFNWLRKKNFGMYSGLSAGVMFLSLSLDSELTKEEDPDAKEETLTSFMFQITALGAEFGGTNFRGFVEAGFGEKGMLCAGLRYKF